MNDVSQSFGHGNSFRLSPFILLAINSLKTLGVINSANRSAFFLESCSLNFFIKKWVLMLSQPTLTKGCQTNWLFIYKIFFLIMQPLSKLLSFLVLSVLSISSIDKFKTIQPTKDKTITAKEKNIAPCLVSFVFLSQALNHRLVHA